MPPNMIPIMRPLLPQAEFIMPYLREIDQNRWYSNFGPLTTQLEKRMAEFFSLEAGQVVSMGNGTAGLTNTLRAMDLPHNTFCIVPSWTFVATAGAACACGLTPYFMDVNEASWALGPETVRKQLKNIPGQVSVVIVVAPFGAPVNTAAWDAFTEETGIAVIIDGAAAFDSVSSVAEAAVGKTPIMISLHATKVLGVGEGGLILSKNSQLITRVREMSNFGFSAPRLIVVPGTNGKMSEYSAAIALAAMDLWPQKREMWMRLKLHYIKALEVAVSKGVSSPWLAEEWVSSTCNVRLPTTTAESVIKALGERGIESRQWWVKGCHRQPAYSKFPHGKLNVTETLVDSVIALPFSLDLKEQEINYITQNLAEIISNQKA